MNAVTESEYQLRAAIERARIDQGMGGIRMLNESRAAHEAFMARFAGERRAWANRGAR